MIYDFKKDNLIDKYLPPYAGQYSFRTIREDCINYLILKEEDKRGNKFNLELFYYYHDIKNYLDHSFLLSYEDFEWVLSHYYSRGFLDRIRGSLKMKERFKRTRDKEAVAFMLLFGAFFLNDQMYMISKQLNISLGRGYMLLNWILERLEMRYDLYIVFMFMCRLMMEIVISKALEWAEENSVARI